MDTPNIETMLNSGKTAHLIGIGGVSMSSLAEFLTNRGIKITGSDGRLSEPVQQLIDQGIKVYIGHHAENINEADYIIRTAAIHDDNPEIVAAHAKGIPVFERAQAFGALMSQYKNAVCFSGTHGKTSSTSMFSCITLAEKLNPSIMLGGILPLIQSGYRVGDKDMFVLEACEYKNSFLSFKPTVSVILNVDEDHMDFFKDWNDISNSFRKFANLTPEDRGVVIANADDEGTLKTVEGISREIIYFGFSEKADVTAKNFRLNHCKPHFDIQYRDVVIKDVSLNVPGRHNASNALAAAAAAFACGISPEAIKKGLEDYTGAERRFEYHGNYNGAEIYDDYAHHPNEIKALFNSALEMGYKRVIAVFQPHTYTRTKAFWNDFIRELSRPTKTILADIYAARETDNLGISSKLLASLLPDGEYYEQYEDIVKRLEELASPGDLILTVGAGEMNQIAEKLSKKGK